MVQGAVVVSSNILFRGERVKTLTVVLQTFVVANVIRGLLLVGRLQMDKVRLVHVTHFRALAITNRNAARSHVTLRGTVRQREGGFRPKSAHVCIRVLYGGVRYKSPLVSTQAC